MDHNKLTGELLPWAKAFFLYEMEGEMDDLVSLLRSDAPMPIEAREWLAKVVTGETKRASRRGKGNTTLSWAARKQILFGLKKVYQNSEIVLAFIEEIADQEAIEEIEVRQRVDKVRRDARELLKTRYDMSEGMLWKLVDISDGTVLGRIMSGTNPDEWAGQWCEGMARSYADRVDEMREFALQAFRNGGDAFNPLTSTDPIA